MNNLIQIQEQHASGPTVIGFDFQFYYFMLLSLELKTGEKIGFEVKDDVHIERSNGKITLFQSKHTILKNIDGLPVNLTTLDIDLWKTLNNWAEMIKVDSKILSNYSFCLATNKGEGNNIFLDALNLFKVEKSIDKVWEIMKELIDKTENAELKGYIKKVYNLGKRLTSKFLTNLIIETNIEDIIGRIKIKILERTADDKVTDAIFDSLYSNMSMTKYLEIKERKKFEISFQEFCQKFGKCFKVAWDKKPLPRRKFQIPLPDDLLDQIFIKQLIDIGEIDKNSTFIIDYTGQMLQTMNHLSYWSDENFILPTEMEEFHRNAIFIWNNEFRAKYREIEREIQSGRLIDDLETEIKKLGVELIDRMRRENLPITNENLGIEVSNGHYYTLSNIPEIGWHFQWEKKYKH